MMRCIAIVSVFALCLVTAQKVVSAQEALTDTSRVILNKVIPSYPEVARRMNLQGNVRLQVTVAPNGSVKLIQTIGGHPGLAKAAEDAVYKFKWSPAKQESKEVIELHFHPE